MLETVVTYEVSTETPRTLWNTDSPGDCELCSCPKKFLSKKVEELSWGALQRDFVHGWCNCSQNAEFQGKWRKIFRKSQESSLLAACGEVNESQRELLKQPRPPI